MREAHADVWGIPPPSPPWWLHALNVRCRSGGPRSSSSYSGFLRARGAPCPFHSPIPVSSLSMPPASEVSSGLSPRPWGLAEAGFPIGSSGASKLYSRCASAPCSGLSPSALSGCLFMLTLYRSPSDMPCCVFGGADGSWLLYISSPRLMLLLPLVSRVAGKFSSPPGPCLSAPGILLPSRVTTEVLHPRGNSSTTGVSVPLGESTPPTTLWLSPPRFSVTPEASGPPSPSRTHEDLPSGFSCWPEALSLSHFYVT